MLWQSRSEMKYYYNPAFFKAAGLGQISKCPDCVGAPYQHDLFETILSTKKPFDETHSTFRDVQAKLFNVLKLLRRSRSSPGVPRPVCTQQLCKRAGRIRPRRACLNQTAWPPGPSKRTELPAFAADGWLKSSETSLKVN